MVQVGFKVGELAKKTGLSVRTLHHYDQIGLLAPAARSESGYRMYGGQDIARLQQIVSLRRLGLSLTEIGDCLDRGMAPVQVMRLHLERLREQIAAQERLCRSLEAIVACLNTAQEVSVNQLIGTIEEMTKMDHGFTPEQMAEIAERGRQYGPEYIKQVEAEWPQLIAKVRAHMEAGTDPADPEVQELGRRWLELVGQFTGGNPEIARVLEHRYQTDQSLQQMTGIDPALMDYSKRVMDAAK